MKKRCLTFCLTMFCLVTIFIVATVQNVLCDQQSDVKIAARNFPVIFADKDISPELQSIIIQDIELVFAHKKASELHIYKPVKRYVEVHGQQQIVKSHINFSGRGNFRPEGYHDTFGQLVDFEGKLSLVIPKALIAAYKEAVSLRTRHKEAFAKLNNFLKDLQYNEYLEQLSISDMREMFWFPKGVKPWTKDKYYEKNIRKIKKYDIREPSLLDFRVDKVNGEEIIFCQTLMTSNIDENFFDMISMVYQSGRWKFRFF